MLADPNPSDDFIWSVLNKLWSVSDTFIWSMSLRCFGLNSSVAIPKICMLWTEDEAGIQVMNVMGRQFKVLNYQYFELLRCHMTDVSTAAKMRLDIKIVTFLYSRLNNVLNGSPMCHSLYGEPGQTSWNCCSTQWQHHNFVEEICFVCFVCV